MTASVPVFYLADQEKEGHLESRAHVVLLVEKVLVAIPVRRAFEDLQVLLAILVLTVQLDQLESADLKVTPDHPEETAPKAIQDPLEKRVFRVILVNLAVVFVVLLEILEIQVLKVPKVCLKEH